MQVIELGIKELEMRNEKSTWDWLKEYTGTGNSRFFGFRRKDDEQKSLTTHRQTEKDFDAQISGWDRVKVAFSLDENKNMNQELCFVKNLAAFGFFGGFLYGGCREYTNALHLFLYSNDTTKYLTVKEAKASLARYTFQAFLKGGLCTAPKTAILCGIFGTVNAAVAAYQGKNGILEFSAAGASTTAVMKWNLGIRGMISGCVSGGLSGLILGTVINICLRTTGNSMSDIKNFVTFFHNKRNEKFIEKKKSVTMSDVEKFYSEKTKDLPSGFPNK